MRKKADKLARRKKNVRRKLNAMALEFVDKNVLLVDGAFLPSLFHLLCSMLIMNFWVR